MTGPQTPQPQPDEKIPEVLPARPASAVEEQLHEVLNELREVRAELHAEKQSRKRGSRIRLFLSLLVLPLLLLPFLLLVMLINNFPASVTGAGGGAGKGGLGGSGVNPAAEFKKAQGQLRGIRQEFYDVMGKDRAARERAQKAATQNAAKRKKQQAEQAITKALDEAGRLRDEVRRQMAQESDPSAAQVAKWQSQIKAAEDRLQKARALEKAQPQGIDAYLPERMSALEADLKSLREQRPGP